MSQWWSFGNRAMIKGLRQRFGEDQEGWSERFTQRRSLVGWTWINTVLDGVAKELTRSGGQSGEQLLYFIIYFSYNNLYLAF
jgi:hypothetical protein